MSGKTTVWLVFKWRHLFPFLSISFSHVHCKAPTFKEKDTHSMKAGKKKQQCGETQKRIPDALGVSSPLRRHCSVDAHHPQSAHERLKRSTSTGGITKTMKKTFFARASASPKCVSTFAFFFSWGQGLSGQGVSSSVYQGNG